MVKEGNSPKGDGNSIENQLQDNLIFVKEENSPKVSITFYFPLPYFLTSQSKGGPPNMKKINSINYGGKVIATGLAFAIALPATLACLPPYPPH